MAEAFDTLTAAQKIQDAGCNPDLAAAIVNQIKNAVTGDVATKADVALLRSDLNAFRSDLKAFRIETKAEFEILRIEMKAGFESLRKEMATAFSPIQAEVGKTRVETSKMWAELAATRERLSKKITLMFYWVAAVGGLVLAISAAVSKFL